MRRTRGGGSLVLRAYLHDRVPLRRSQPCRRLRRLQLVLTPSATGTGWRAGSAAPESRPTVASCPAERRLAMPPQQARDPAQRRAQRRRLTHRPRPESATVPALSCRPITVVVSRWRRSAGTPPAPPRWSGVEGQTRCASSRSSSATRLCVLWISAAGQPLGWAAGPVSAAESMTGTTSTPEQIGPGAFRLDQWPPRRVGRGLPPGIRSWRVWCWCQLRRMRSPEARRRRLTRAAR